jgi:hydrogenase maturation protein HypF
VGEVSRRLGITVRGVVQAVGFRPFVHRLAGAHGLAGWVRNEGEGVRVEVEGATPDLDAFVAALRAEAPPGAAIAAIAIDELPPAGERSFAILESDPSAAPAASLSPDTAPCAECLREIASPGERRRGYPFTNCTRCGPRYTIALGLPYDRERTTMRDFPLCAACAAEHGDPRDRRFHAQPIACPRCGPVLRARTPAGEELAAGEAAIALAARALARGDVCALKGVGGYQLLADAASEAAVGLLRTRKHREEKPFAVMFPSVEALRARALVSAEEEAALTSPAAPIVLVRRAPGCDLAAAVAPRSPWIGAMLPSSPLHHLLLAEAARPLVCTSGNLSGEPLAVDDDDARARLGAIADLFLVHDRPIARPVDDSLARVGPGGIELLRRARGFVPLAIPLGEEGPVIVALGGHLKSTVALSLGREAILSQHLGDLDDPGARALLERTVEDLLHFFGRRPAIVACDLHPDYASTILAERLAARFGAALERVQHHHAHVAACMAEHGLDGPVLGFAWDGLGLGTDGELWGGEALLCEGASFRRVACLRPFRLPGGDAAAREPRRAAAGLLHAMEGRVGDEARAWFGAGELEVIERMLAAPFNAPRTTSVGRLFDAVAALAGGRLAQSFEGQAAMELEYAADACGEEEAYPLPLREGEPLIGDWGPLVRALLADRDRGVPMGVMSARFHEALGAFAAEVAARVGAETVALSGGCFQNRRLFASVRRRIEAQGVRVVSHARVPPNDGGLALGQALIAARRWRLGVEQGAGHGAG